jgi:hypothetical protein
MPDDESRSWIGAIGAKIADVEAFAGLLLSTFIFLVVVCLGGGLVLVAELAGGAGSMHLSAAQKGLSSGVYLLVLIFEVRSLGWITRGLQDRRRSPRAVWLAMSQRDRGLLTNLIVASWWIVHMVAILLVGAGLDAFCTKAAQGHGRDAAIVAGVIGVLFVFTAAFMTSSFLVLAIGAWRRDETLLRRVWRLRGLLDASLALGVLAVMEWV